MIRFVDLMDSDELALLSKPFAIMEHKGFEINFRRVEQSWRRSYFCAYIRVNSDFDEKGMSFHEFVEVVGNNKWLGIDTAQLRNKEMTTDECFVDSINQITYVIDRVIKYSNRVKTDCQHFLGETQNINGDAIECSITGKVRVLNDNVCRKCVSYIKKEQEDK